MLDGVPSGFFVFGTASEEHRHVADPVDQVSAALKRQLFDECIAFDAIGRIDLDLDQFMSFEGLVEFFEQSGVDAVLAHPDCWAQTMGSFFQLADEGRRKW